MEYMVSDLRESEPNLHLPQYLVYVFPIRLEAHNTNGFGGQVEHLLPLLNCWQATQDLFQGRNLEGMYRKNDHIHVNISVIFHIGSILNLKPNLFLKIFLYFTVLLFPGLHFAGGLPQLREFP